MTKYATYESPESDIEVTFSSEGCMDDYSVPNSPVFWTPTEIEVEELFILGCKQDFKKLSPEVQDAILDLTGYFCDSDWE